MCRYELDRRRFLTASACSLAAAALPLTHVQDIAARTAAVRTGHTVGMAEVAAVRDMITAFSEMDERHGGQHGRSALVTYLRDDVAPLCPARFRTDEVRRQPRRPPRMPLAGGQAPVRPPPPTGGLQDHQWLDPSRDPQVAIGSNGGVPFPCAISSAQDSGGGPVSSAGRQRTAVGASRTACQSEQPSILLATGRPHASQAMLGQSAPLRPQ